MFARVKFCKDFNRPRFPTMSMYSFTFTDWLILPLSNFLLSEILPVNHKYLVFNNIIKYVLSPPLGVGRGHYIFFYDL